MTEASEKKVPGCRKCGQLQPTEGSLKGWSAEIVKTEMTAEGPMIYALHTCPTCQPS